MQIRRLSARRNSRRGAATVELTLVLPFLAFLFVIAFDFSRIFYFAVTISSCARNGALYAANPTLSDKLPYASVQEAALADAVGLKTQPSVSVTMSDDTAVPPWVEVSVSYPFTTVTHFPGVPSSTTITRKVRMVRVIVPPDDGT
jgi:Flp pilus assembly protein TadG